MKNKFAYKLFLLLLAILFLLTGCGTGPNTVWCLTERRSESPGSESAHLIRFEYDDRGNVLRAYTGKEGNLVLSGECTYDRNNRRLTEMQYIKETDTSTTYRYEYDRKGNMVKKITQMKDSADWITQYAYDTRGNLVSVASYTEGQPESEWYRKEWDYDLKGNKTQLREYTGRDGLRIRTYDKSGREWDPSDGYSYIYDDRGYLIERSIGLGTEDERIFRWDYDKDGNMVLESLETKGRMNYEIMRTYDQNGNLLTEVGDGKTDYAWEWTYDKAGRPLTYVSDWGQTTWEYNQYGNLVRETNCINNRTSVINYSYIAVTLPADQVEAQRAAQEKLMEAAHESYVFAD